MLSSALAAQPVLLKPGAARRFTIFPQSHPPVLTGITVAVPGGASRLTIDVQTDVLSNDVSLWARFGRDVVVTFGTVTTADFSSQTIGPEAGRERISISSIDSPPLQTGTYYIAIGASPITTPITGSITATLEGGGTIGTLIASTFDADTDGWTTNFPRSNLPGASEGDFASFVDWSNLDGNPGGFLRLNDATGGKQDFAAAPQKFLGNLAAMSSPRIEFDYRHLSGQESLFSLKLRILGNGSLFEWTAGPPSTSWTHYTIALRRDLQRASGLASLEEVLSNVQRIEISMDQALGAETNGIDNFKLIGDLAPPALTGTPAAPVRSTFDAGAEGWGRNYPPLAIPGSSAGDPASSLSWLSDGSLQYTEAGGLDDDFFVAPPKFLGNIAGILNPVLEFDYRHLAQPPGLDPIVVRLAGAGASFLWIGGQPSGFGQASHFRVPLNENFFVRESGTASFAQLLAAVQRIEISADQSSDAEVDTLDNVALLSAATPPLRPTLSAAPANLRFTAVAGGSNPQSQTLQINSGDAGSAAGGGPLAWTAGVEPAAPWLNLSATSGSTPSTVTVTVNTSGLSAGSYAARIIVTAGAAANSPQSITVSLTVNLNPATLPRINSGSIGNTASYRPPATPGGLTTLFGVNLGPPDGAQTSFVSGSQRLPTSFRGVRLLVRDAGGALIAEAPLLFVSATQINFQMPFEAAARFSVAVVVDNNGVLSAPETVQLASAGPAVFTSTENRAIAQNQDFSLNTSTNPAPRGGVLIVYLTGQGSVSPAVPTGQAAPLSPLSVITGPPAASIGGVPATVLFLGLTPGLVGVAQANVLIPESAPLGDQTLLLSSSGQPANGAIVSIRQ